MRVAFASLKNEMNGVLDHLCAHVGLQVKVSVCRQDFTSLS